MSQQKLCPELCLSLKSVSRQGIICRDRTSILVLGVLSIVCLNIKFLVISNLIFSLHASVSCHYLVSLSRPNLVIPLP